MFNWKNRMIMYIFEITRVLSWEMMDRIDIIHRMTQTSFILCFSYQSKTDNRDQLWNRLNKF